MTHDEAGSEAANEAASQVAPAAPAEAATSALAIARERAGMAEPRTVCSPTDRS